MGNDTSKLSEEGDLSRKSEETNRNNSISSANGHIPRSILRRNSKADETSLESENSVVRSVVFVDQIESMKLKDPKSDNVKTPNGGLNIKTSAPNHGIKYSYQPFDDTESTETKNEPRSSFLVERSKAYLKNIDINNAPTGEVDTHRRTKRTAPQPPVQKPERLLSTISEEKQRHESQESIHLSNPSSEKLSYDAIHPLPSSSHNLTTTLSTGRSFLPDTTSNLKSQGPLYRKADRNIKSGPLKAIHMDKDDPTLTKSKVQIEYDSTMLFESKTFEPYAQSYATISKSSLSKLSQSIGLSTLPNRFYQSSTTQFGSMRPTILGVSPEMIHSDNTGSTNSQVIYANPDQRRKSLSTMSAFETRAYDGMGSAETVLHGKFDSMPIRYKPGPLNSKSLLDVKWGKSSPPSNDNGNIKTDVKHENEMKTTDTRKSTDSLPIKKSSTVILRKIGNSISKKFNSLGRPNMKERKSVGSLFDLRAESTDFEIDKSFTRDSRHKSGSHSDLSFSDPLNESLDKHNSLNSIWYHVAKSSHESFGSLSTDNPLFVPDDPIERSSIITTPTSSTNNNQPTVLTTFTRNSKPDVSKQEKPVTEFLYGEDECISYL